MSLNVKIRAWPQRCAAISDNLLLKIKGSLFYRGCGGQRKDGVIEREREWGRGDRKRKVAEGDDAHVRLKGSV